MTKEPPASRTTGVPFRQLEIFHAVMTTHSVSAASRLLAVSQPSVSRTLKRLEDQLKVPLFHRHRRRLVPTTEATRLFADVDAVIARVHALTGSIARIAGGHTSLFRFGATQSVGRFFVPRAIRILTDRHPALQVFLDALLRVQHVDYLVSSQGECIVTLAEVDHPLIASRVLGTAPLVAMLPARHPLRTRDRLRAADLAEVDLIGFEHSGPHSLALGAFFAGQPAPRYRAYVRFADAAVALAAQGVGVALVDAFTTHGLDDPHLVRRPLVDAPTFTARLYWNGERPTSRLVGAFGDAFVAALGERPAET